ncbi:formylglycine-generating enzyme family protein [Bremerella volcania]|uniref:formylglycine-generating enzyme family protein n=1 Tax=Bremerella volcania TaxID=2527984 RepID=UPI0011A98CB7|nr:formylglycine-generating enzyme family protein [Bremerella volcania]
MLAASPPLYESEGAYAKYIDGVTELHAKNLFFTDIIAKDAIIRAKIRKIEGSWGGFYLRSNKDHIALYSVTDRQFHIWAHDGEQHMRLAEITVDDEKSDFFELAFATIGETLSAYVDGKKIYEGQDERATDFAGMPAIRASFSPPRSTFQFKDVEIMVLDPPLTEQEQEQLTAMQWACRNGAKMNGYINDKFVAFDRTKLPVAVPTNGIMDFDMREMTNVSVENVAKLNRLPNVHRVFNAPPGADDFLLQQLIQTPGINFAPHLDIRDSLVTDEFFEHLRDMPNLYGVCFNNTQVSSKALNHLLNLKNKGIMAENCLNIDDHACEILATRSRWLWLTLSGTSITDQGLEKLSACSGLGSVDVRRCNVTETAIQRLSEALPTLEIIWDGGRVGPKSKPVATYKNARGMQFALIPRGKAWLGGGDGKPGTTEVVFTEDFYLGTTEVTQEQWHSVMGRNPSYFQHRSAQNRHNETIDEKLKGLAYEDLKKLPVEMISWEEIQRFMAKLNSELNEEGWTYRLPTEAEWEYACRNGPMTTQAESAFSYYFAEGTNRLEMDQANVGNRLGRTDIVASYQPNKLGLYDMHGNLYEWCHDTVADKNGQIRHPVRGGGFFQGPDQNKTTKRNLDPPDFRNFLSGFRIARVRNSQVVEAHNEPINNK